MPLSHIEPSHRSVARSLSKEAKELERQKSSFLLALRWARDPAFPQGPYADLHHKLPDSRSYRRTQTALLASREVKTGPPRVRGPPKCANKAPWSTKDPQMPSRRTSMRKAWNRKPMTCTKPACRLRFRSGPGFGDCLGLLRGVQSSGLFRLKDLASDAECSWGRQLLLGQDSRRHRVFAASCCKSGACAPCKSCNSVSRTRNSKPDITSGGLDLQTRPSFRPARRDAAAR